MNLEPLKLEDVALLGSQCLENADETVLILHKGSRGDGELALVLIKDDMACHELFPEAAGKILIEHNAFLHCVSLPSEETHYSSRSQK